MAHTLDTSRLEEVFDELEENLEKLNSWEQGFIASVKDQWERKKKLTEDQLEKLEEVYQKV